MQCFLPFLASLIMATFICKFISAHLHWCTEVLLIVSRLCMTACTVSDLEYLSSSFIGCHKVYMTTTFTPSVCWWCEIVIKQAQQQWKPVWSEQLTPEYLVTISVAFTDGHHIISSISANADRPRDAALRKINNIVHTECNYQATSVVQTPLGWFVVSILYKQVCNKYSDKSNWWSLSLSV